MTFEEAIEKEEKEYKVPNQAADVIEKIFQKALDQVDIIASYQHYLILGKIKVIWKDKKNDYL